MGYAIYKPVSNTIMKPGSVGFFTSDGSWHQITNLDDPTSLALNDLSPPSKPLSKAPTEKIENYRSPKMSSGTTEYTSHAGAGAE